MATVDLKHVPGDPLTLRHAWASTSEDGTAVELSTTSHAVFLRVKGEDGRVEQYSVSAAALCGAALDAFHGVALPTYRTSKDYGALWEVANAGAEIVCLVDYRSSRDVAKTKAYLGGSVDVGARGIVYMSAETLEDFVAECQRVDLEWFPIARDDTSSISSEHPEEAINAGRLEMLNDVELAVSEINSDPDGTAFQHGKEDALAEVVDLLTRLRADAPTTVSKDAEP